MKLRYIAKDEDNGKILKNILKKKLELSERLIKKLKMEHKILLNNIPTHINATINPWDIIEVSVEIVEAVDDIIPQNIPIDILFEDESLIIINKQPGIVVHPTCAHLDGTLANALAYHLQNVGLSIKIRPVIRLDRDTSGIIIFAKNPFAQEYLIKQMHNKTFNKEYFGIVHGRTKETQGTIDLPIERKPGSIMVRHVSSTGDRSITHYETLEVFENCSLLKFSLETGRTHQIRVHCQAIGNPLIGDSLYPPLEPLNSHDYSHTIKRQALHSTKVVFTHPVTKRTLEITAPLPDDIKMVLEILRK